MVPVCDKRYHIYNRFRHFWAEIKKLWNYPLEIVIKKYVLRSPGWIFQSVLYLVWEAEIDFGLDPSFVLKL